MKRILELPDLRSTDGIKDLKYPVAVDDERLERERYRLSNLCQKLNQAVGIYAAHIVRPKSFEEIEQQVLPLILRQLPRKMLERELKIRFLDAKKIAVSIAGAGDFSLKADAQKEFLLESFEFGEALENAFDQFYQNAIGCSLPEPLTYRQLWSPAGKFEFSKNAEKVLEQACTHHAFTPQDLNRLLIAEKLCDAFNELADLHIPLGMSGNTMPPFMNQSLDIDTARQSSETGVYRFTVALSRILRQRQHVEILLENHEE